MNNVLTLPHTKIEFDYALPPEQVLLVAGGRPPAVEWLRQMAAESVVWCVDSGIDICHASGVVPARIIGDGDSVSSKGWEWGKSLGVPIDIHPPEKDLTDLQLALSQVAAVYKQARVIVTGVWGGRFDHAFANIYSLLGSNELGLTVCLAADQAETLILTKGESTVKLNFEAIPEVISLLPLSKVCQGVSISGVHWPLHAVKLYQTLPYAVSNRPEGGQGVTVEVKDGWLGIYLGWETNSL